MGLHCQMSISFIQNKDYYYYYHYYYYYYYYYIPLEHGQ